MANKKCVVNLGGEKRKRLQALISKDKASAEVILKTHLRQADQAEAGEGRR